jgi:hypothetical protein
MVLRVSERMENLNLAPFGSGSFAAPINSAMGLGQPWEDTF